MKSKLKLSRVLLSAVLLTALLAACGDDDPEPTGNAATYTVSGTLTIPASVTNKKWYLAVDADDTGENGLTAVDSGTVTGSSISYSISNIPSGNYYIYTEVDMTGDLGPWESGDYVGMGCQLANGELCKVAITSSKTINIDLAMYP